MVHSGFIYLDISDTYYIRYISYLYIYFIYLKFFISILKDIPTGIE